MALFPSLHLSNLAAPVNKNEPMSVTETLFHSTEQSNTASPRLEVCMPRLSAGIGSKIDE